MPRYAGILLEENKDPVVLQASSFSNWATGTASSKTHLATGLTYIDSPPSFPSLMRIAGAEYSTAPSTPFYYGPAGVLGISAPI